MLRASTLRRHLLATALCLGALPLMSHAQSNPAVAAVGTLLNVSASGEVRRAPDIAVLSTGVVTQAVDANAAMRANAEQMSAVIAAIKAAGIAERDVQTGGVNLSPQYRYAENQPPTITGYQASNTVNITVRDLARLGKTLDALVATGANQINGPSPRQGPGPCRDVRQGAGCERAPHRQPQRRRQLRPAAAHADDGHARGEVLRHPHRPRRKHPVGEPRGGVRTRQVSRAGIGPPPAPPQGGERSSTTLRAATPRGVPRDDETSRLIPITIEHHHARHATPPPQRRPNHPPRARPLAAAQHITVAAGTTR
jgi:hypothetical protein